MEAALLLAAAFLLDALLGDPPALPHPVRFLGWFIHHMERRLRALFRVPAPLAGVTGESPASHRHIRRERLAGLLLLLFTVLVAAFIPWLLVRIGTAVHPLLGHLVTGLLLYSALATRCLSDEGLKVARVLETGDLPAARRQLSMLVGRQTDHLDAQAVARGAAETVAENTVDGVLSVLFFAVTGLFLGLAAPLVWAFKAVSTLDSMVGYKNERYRYFGTASARADDALNFIPARLSGLLVPLAAWCCGLDARGSWRTIRRDHSLHASPNSGWPESAFAGALGVRFGGPNIYFGRTVEKPWIGEAKRDMTAERVRAAVRLMWVTSALGLLAAIAAVGGMAAGSLFR